MYLLSLQHAFPPHRFSQAEGWARFAASPTAQRLRPRSVGVIRRVLTGDSGIESRHFALPELETLFELDAQALAQAFEREAPRLAAAALRPALTRAGITAADLDALFVCTCSGYLCPGVTSHVAEQLGLRPDAYLADLVGLGCGAAIPTLRAAHGFLAAQPQARVAVIAVEICSAAFYLNDDLGVLVSACLFGDGASASVWTGQPPADRPVLRLSDFDTIHRPELRETIRFVNAGGKLCNQLARSVPEDAAAAVAHLWSRTRREGVSTIIAHSGGRDVIDALEARLPGWTLPWTRDLLRRAGNLSSPSVLVALQDFLDAGGLAPGQAAWLTAFGAGFAAHAARLERLPTA